MQQQFAKSLILYMIIVFGMVLGVGLTFGNDKDCKMAQELLEHVSMMPSSSLQINTMLEKERLYRKIIDICPDYPEAHNNLGDVYEIMGRFDEALKEYQLAIALDSTFPHPYFGIGDILFKNGDYGAAVRWYDKGLLLNPSDQLTKELRRQANALLHGRIIPKETIIEVLKRLKTRGPAEVVKLTLGTDGSKGLIPFKKDDATLTEEGKRQLQELGKALNSQKLKGYVFEIAGHTDSQGNESANLKLSLDRANAVKIYLASHFKIESARLHVKGYGDSRPLAIGDDEASHALNRRVEIVRIEPAGQHSTGKNKGQSMLLDFSVLYRNREDQQWKPIRSDGTTVLRTGKDRYQIFFRAHQICHIYLLQVDSGGNWFFLYPNKATKGPTNPVDPGKDYWVPKLEFQGFPLDETAGSESIYVIMTREKIDFLEGPMPPPDSVLNSVLRSLQAQGVRTLTVRGIAKVGPLPATTLESDGPTVQRADFLHK